MVRTIHAAIALFVFAASSSAQTPPQVAPSLGPRNCTVHVWAQPHIVDDITGIFPGGVMREVETAPYREKMKRGKTSITKMVLTPELLLSALRESRFGPELGVPADRFILERDNKTIKTFARTKRSPSDACSYGLDFNIIYFQKSVVAGRRLILVPRFFDASGPGKPRSSVWSNTEQVSSFNPLADDREIEAVLKDGVRRALDDLAVKKLARARS